MSRLTLPHEIEFENSYNDPWGLGDYESQHHVLFGRKEWQNLTWDGKSLRNQGILFQSCARSLYDAAPEFKKSAAVFLPGYHDSISHDRFRYFAQYAKDIGLPSLFINHANHGIVGGFKAYAEECCGRNVQTLLAPDPSTILHYLDDSRFLIDAFIQKRPHIEALYIIGHSMAGCMAMEIAQDQQSRGLNTAVIALTPPVGLTDNNGLIEFLNKKTKYHRIIDGRRYLENPFIDGMTYSQEYVSDWASLRLLSRRYIFPMTIIAPAKDRISPIEHIQYFATQQPRSPTLQLIEGANHGMMDNPSIQAVCIALKNIKLNLG